jgi:CBS domain-containing protein
MTPFPAHHSASGQRQKGPVWRRRSLEEEAMTVKSILEEKGRDVITLPATETIEGAVKTLANHKIGALIIASASGKIEGILSERDIVRIIAGEGASALKKPVTAAMTSKVKTCTEASTVNEVMETMTKGRFRHLPVEHGGKIAGIISIGDVVKRRIREIERETEQIKQYIATV